MDGLFHNVYVVGFLTSKSYLCWCGCPSHSEHFIDSYELSRYQNPQVAKDIGASNNALVDLFERIEAFFKHLKTYTKVPLTKAMTDLTTKIMIEVLLILAITTKEIKKGFASGLVPQDITHLTHTPSGKYLRKLVGRTNIEDTLKRLDKLTQEEARMANAQVLLLAHTIIDGARSVLAGQQVYT
jgi:hypothetical protein